MADATLHPFVREALRDVIARRQSEELRILNDIIARHDLLYPSFLEELQRFFFQHFYTTLRPDKQPGWDLVRANQVGATEYLTALTDDLLSAVSDEIDPLLDEETEAAAEEGWVTGLWLLNVSGLPTDDSEEEDVDYGAILVAAAIGGLLARDRAAQWRNLYRDKLLQSVQANIAIGGTLTETTDVATLLWQDYVRSVSAMAANEVYWGFAAGEHELLALYAGLVDEVWVTENDAAVCYICSERHMKRTPLQPIWDSHPGCRCVKAPLLLIDGEPVPIDFATFADARRRYA